MHNIPAPDHMLTFNFKTAVEWGGGGECFIFCTMFAPRIFCSGKG